MADIMDQIENLTPYKMVSLIKAINSRLDQSKEYNMYVIRNGRYFYKEATKSAVSTKYLKGLKMILWNKLIEFVNSKDVPHTFVSAGKFRIAMPTSEKNFIGDTPIGSYIDLSDVEEAILGIYWKNEWGTVRDYDLHFNTIDGKHYGWNSAYHDGGQSVTFSGDMTNAQPEAAELYWFKNLGQAIAGGLAGVISANDFTCGKSKFRLFVAIPSQNGSHKMRTRNGQYAVDPNDVLMRADIPTDHSVNRETQCGLIFDSKLFVANLANRPKNVPSLSVSDVIKPIGTNLEYIPCIEDLLRDAGWTETTEDDESIGINLKDFKGIDLINLISK
jgi:hypothetical protein